MMSEGPRRRFAAAFKAQAVARLSVPGATQVGVAHETGITSSPLKRWRLELEASGSATPSGARRPRRRSWSSCDARVAA